MKKILSLFLVLCMLFSVNIYGLSLTYENEEGKTIRLTDFLDTQGHWAHDTIWKVADYGLIVGSNGNFMPDQPIKRGDLAIIIDRMLGLKSMSYNYFNDLYNSDYYAESLLKCVAAEYITGVGINQIDPNGYATREQVSVILSRIFDLNSTNYNSYTNFKDDSKISSWARGSVSVMSKLGYINGTDKGYFNPQSYITRAELVTMLNNIANTYIPKKVDALAGGTSEYKNHFPTNVVTSRNVVLVDSIVNRDLIVTQDAGGVTLKNTTIKGRLLVMAKSNISLNDSSISQIVLLDGKTTISGITNDVYSVRVTLGASESTLDNIPYMLILESGARVKINGTMYENESTREKTYYASNLQADISDEQGYVVGGPRISGSKFEQDMDNTITVSNIRITEGENDIKEIGVVWLEQEDDENAKNPTYKKNDGKKIYKSDKIDELISFEVGEIEGTCAYRVYVKDKNGLFAYSNSFIFSEYKYSTTLKIYDNNYPEKVDVEIVLRGESVPDISNVRVVYDIDELYSENHKEISLRLYSDADAEYQPDTTKYKRYIGTINSDTERVNGETVYTPPTAFGYIITFKNGTLINRFPILTNAVPEGVSPMANLETGNAVYISGNSLTIKDNIITTRYVVPQEVGIVYKTSTSESVSRPTANASGWIKKESYASLDVNEHDTFSVSIPLLSTEGYTYYSAYVKTSNGYWYGDVKKFNNSVQGDDGGPLLNSSINPVVVSPNEVFIPFTFSNVNNGLYHENSKFVLNIRKNGEIDTDWSLNNYDFYDIKIFESEGKGYLHIIGIEENCDYEIDFQLLNKECLKSNLVVCSFNSNNYEKFSLTEKSVVSNNIISYTLIKPDEDCTVIGVSLINSNNETVHRVQDTISIREINDISMINNIKLKIQYRYDLKDVGFNKELVSSQIIDLY